MTLCRTFSIDFQCRRKSLLQHLHVRMRKDRKAFQATHRRPSLTVSLLPKMHRGQPHRRHSPRTKTLTSSTATETFPRSSKQHKEIQQRSAIPVFALRSRLCLLWLDRAISPVFLLFPQLKGWIPTPSLTISQETATEATRMRLLHQHLSCNPISKAQTIVGSRLVASHTSFDPILTRREAI